MISAGRRTRGLCDLFARDAVTDFIETIARSTEVSILAGAGTSIESGFPDWTSLVRRLLVQVAAEQGLAEESCGAFATWTIHREGLTAAAAVAKTALGERFAKELHVALYTQQLTPPGQTALAIAQMAASFSDETFDVSTTNYDLVLESAIESVSGAGVRAATRSAGNSDQRVLHLHGVVQPRGGIKGDLILSERDYFLMPEDTAWQQRYFAERLENSLCLFVGASLTDPNLLRYLYRSDVSSEHWAIFVRQQDADIYDEADDELVKLRERTSEGRWLQAGIRPLHADYFSQSAQLLHEVLHFRSTKARRRKYKALPQRLRRWRSRVNETALTTRDADFAAIQDELHETMRNSDDRVNAEHPRQRPLSGPEHFAPQVAARC